MSAQAGGNSLIVILSVTPDAPGRKVKKQLKELISFRHLVVDTCSNTSEAEVLKRLEKMRSRGGPCIIVDAGPELAAMIRLKFRHTIWVCLLLSDELTQSLVKRERRRLKAYGMSKGEIRLRLQGLRAGMIVRHQADFEILCGTSPAKAAMKFAEYIMIYERSMSRFSGNS